MANCITLVRIVIAPTATSPPYLSSEELKHTEITLSLDCMIKAALPSAMHGSTSLKLQNRVSFFSRSSVFLPVRKRSTQAQETLCEITVASAAPRTPICRPKMNSGSSAMLITAPMSTVHMPMLAKPCAVMKAFMPSVSCTKIVPSA